MTTPEISLTWSSTYVVARNTKALPGDKILLPQSALEQLLAASTVTTTGTSRPSQPFDPFNPYSLAAARAEQSQWRDTQQQLPHPLTFRLVNSKNGNVVYAGIREFSAGESEVRLSPFLLEALDIKETDLKAVVQQGSSDAPIDLEAPDQNNSTSEDETIRITVHAKQLPKGTYVRLRPLEAGYNPDDWKSLLEKHLRENFTTLTKGELLTVRGPKSEEFRFLIDKLTPEGDGICVVDTDLEVDIEALNEEQARETLKQIMAKSQRAPGTAEGSSIGGELSIWKPTTGQVASGDYVDYQLSSWDKSQWLEIGLESEDGGNIELFVSPFSTRQRARPREDEHVFGDFSNNTSKKIAISPTNIELESAESLLISVYVPESDIPQLRKFSLSVKCSSQVKASTPGTDMEMHGPDEDQCKNCHQWVPKRTMMLHENFCLRNNVSCPHCKIVFKKNTLEWNSHWHCPHDSEFGNSPESKSKHDELFHTTRSCPNCPYEAANVRDLASHRTSICPAKIILCQFCHLEVPQEGDPYDPSPEVLISGLTAHELADGARTTECHLCSKIIRLRDMSTHLKHHELEKSSKSAPSICRNVNCGRTLDGVGKNGEIGAGSRTGQGPGNELGLCSICFGPLYVSMHDPEGKAMKRRVERRYLTQLVQGCGKAWCSNLFCKTAKAKNGDRTTLGTKEALPLVQPLMITLNDQRAEMYFCVDEGSQKRRKLAEMVAAEKVYEMEWCVAAFEAENGNLDNARRWLENWAPKIK